MALSTLREVGMGAWHEIKRSVPRISITIPRFNRAQKGAFGYGTEGTYYGGLVGRSRELTYDKYGAALAYMSEPSVHRAVNLIADAMNALPYKIVRNSTSDRAKDETVAESTDPRPRHVFMRALYDAHQDAKQSLLWLSAYSLLTYGDNFLEPTRETVIQAYVGLKWLNPLAMSIMVSGGEITRYQYTYPGGGGTEMFDPQEIVHDYTRNPFDDFRGLSKVVVAMRKINILRNVDRSVDARLRNREAPDLTIAPKGDNTKFSDPDIERLKRHIRNQLQGPGNQGRVFISPTAAEWLSHTQPELDKDYGLVDPITRTVFTTFGIPLSMAGDDAGTQYKASDPIKVAFYQNTIIPFAKDFAQFLNYEVMPRFDSTGTDRFEFDTSEYDLVSDDDQLRADVAGANVNSGIWTVNEGRVYTGKDPADDGDIYMLNGTPIPKEEYLNIWRYKVLIAPSVYNTPEITGEPLPQPVEPDQVVPTDEGGQAVEAPQSNVTDSATTPQLLRFVKAVATDTPAPYAICAYFAGNAELVKLQDMLRGMLQGHEAYEMVEFPAPETFHTTLVYCPSGFLYQMQDNLPLNPGAFSVTVDGVGVFDTPGGYAVHLALRKEGTLPAMQSALAQMLRGAHVELSPFSEPDAYTPHITLAYAPFAVKPFTITPFSLLVNRVEVSNEAHKPVISQALKARPSLNGKAHQTTADDELRAWQKCYEQSGVNKALRFEPDKLRGDLGDWIAEGLRTAGEDADARGRIFDEATTRLALKAIASTRLDFENAFDAVLKEALAGAINRQRFGSIVRQLIRTYGFKAYADGLRDTGVDEDPDESEQDEIARLVSEQSAYVTGLADRLYKDEAVTEAMADQKASMWFNGSIAPFYSAGKLAADANAMHEWVLGKTEKHCETCAALNGKRARYKTWYRKNLIAGTVGQATVCSGYQCDCELVKVSGKAKGNVLAMLFSEDLPQATVA